jgi:Quinohemoprotein amine dehydrogenase, alpha subunit domain III/IPT/TIG domain
MRRRLRHRIRSLRLRRLRAGVDARPARSFGRQRRVGGLVLLAMTAAAATAIAYWTTSGSGSANGSVAALKAPAISSASGGQESAALSWTSVTPPSSGSVTYFVKRDGGTPSGNCPTSTAPTSATSCSDSSVSPGAHSYTVTAVWRSWTATSKAQSVVVKSNPGVESATPSSRGQGASKQSVTIKGNNFVSGVAASFGAGVTVESTKFESATQLKATITVEAGATTGGRTVTVTNPDQGVGSKESAFTVNAGPTVESTTPSSRGQGASKQSITIKGKSFVSGAKAAFGAGITVESTSFVSATELKATVSVESAAATGARTVTVTNPDEGVGSKESAFTVNAKPTVTATSPSSRGQGAASQTIKITGSGFSSGASLAASFGEGIKVNSTTFVSATEITASITVEASAATGKRSVTVTNGDAGVGSGSEVFAVNAGPTVESTSPSSGDQGGAETVAIKGKAFVSGAKATFGAGVTVESTSFVSATELTAKVTIESGATTGARTVTVINPDEGVGSLASAFTVNGKPTVTATSPGSRGQGASKQTIKITGTNFESGAGLAVAFSGTGITVESTSFVSATEVTASVTVASNATTGAREATVTNPDTTKASLASAFTVNAGPTVSKPSEASPAEVPHGGEAAVSITGEHFVSGLTASLSNSSEFELVGGVTFNSSTSLTIHVKSTGGKAKKTSFTLTNPDAGSVTCTNCIHD